MTAHTYYRLCVFLKGHPKTLYRELLFPENGTLDTLAVTVISIFNAGKWEEYFLSDAARTYCCTLPLRRNNRYTKANEARLSDLSLSDNTFTMTYFRDVFIIEILETCLLERRFRIPLVTGGTGYGVATEGMNYLSCYLDGSPIPHPITFWKSGKKTDLDFNTFDLADCNRRLRRDYSRLLDFYDSDPFDSV